MHKISIPSWVPERALFRLDPPDVTRTALIVVDMQIVFLEQGQMYATHHGEDVIGNINRLAAAVRNEGGKIVFTRHTATDTGPGAMPGWQLSKPEMKRAMYEPFLPHLRAHELDPRVDYQPEDIVVDKYRFGAFAKNSSELDQILRNLGIETLIIVGVATNCCCETTARDASQLGYKTFFITDATATMTDEEHNATLMTLGTVFADLRSTEDMLQLISQAHRTV